LAGRYRVLDTLGAGGMGVVFRAENLVTTKRVAIKWLSRPLSRTATEERLLREARAVARLKHPNVVDVYDLVRDGSTWFLVMELLEGETLREYLRRSPAPTVPALIRVLLPAIEGVAAAHARGVVHRDLKPENIFLERVSGDGRVVPKVLDFGIAKLSDLDGKSLTETGMALGTPLYMSLEQLRADKDVDARADVYAFGVMLYEAFTGRMPFAAGSLPELALKMTTAEPTAVGALRPDLPPALARIVDWAIARKADERLPDLSTLRNELDAFSREQSFRALMSPGQDSLPCLAEPIERGASRDDAEPAGVLPHPGVLTPATQRHSYVRGASWAAVVAAVAVVSLLLRAYWPAISSAAPMGLARLVDAPPPAPVASDIAVEVGMSGAHGESAVLAQGEHAAIGGSVQAGDPDASYLEAQPTSRSESQTRAPEQAVTKNAPATVARGKPANRAPQRPRQAIVELLAF
jgi:serine/threonine-protein kinase